MYKTKSRLMSKQNRKPHFDMKTFEVIPNSASTNDFSAENSFHSMPPWLPPDDRTGLHSPTQPFDCFIVATANSTLSFEPSPCNATDVPPWSSIVVTPLEVVLCIVLSAFIMATIVGNVFVILAVALFDKMRTMSNVLIASLASADLLVAIVVLPISLQKEIVGHWTLGPYVCDLWITSDVFCCTASILNIVVIAVDRYWLITKHVRYTHSTLCPRRRVCALMLLLAWSVSALISCSPLIGWRKGTEKDDPALCLISQDYGYTVFSTFGAFWAPLLAILAVYLKIFRFARLRAAKRSQPAFAKPEVSLAVVTQCNSLMPPEGFAAEGASIADLSPTPPESAYFPSGIGGLGGGVGGGGGGGGVCGGQQNPAASAAAQARASRCRKNRSRRIRRSARTLGLIIGGFLVCWMPFFLIATVVPFCEGGCEVPPLVFSLVLWLGYSNSLLNPAIYAIWDISFRRSFVKLATCDVR